MEQHIGPYQIENELGRGGMGVVYRAHDPRLGRTVAIKALPEELAGDAGRLERFEREARTLAQLNHANLAGIHGLEEHGGNRYLVLEFVEGETLGDRLDRGVLDVDEAVELAAQIAAGIEAAHEAGIVHRDLKPANVMITPDGRAKVLDFGLARTDEGASSTGSGMSQSPTMTNPQPKHSPTIPGAILGTAAYMSPEQARGRRVDKRTDVWSFGVLLYEMLVGASPFVGETAGDSIGAVLHKTFDLDQLPEATPATVRRVLRRCLQRDKSQRYRDIGDARLELLSGSVDEAVGVWTNDSKGGLASWPVVIAAALIAMVGGLLAGRVLLAPAPEAPVPMHVSVPAPMWMRAVGGIAKFDIDSTGMRLAFIGLVPGTEDEPVSAVYLRDLRESQAVRLPGTEHAQKVSFDPTGRTVAFTYDPPDGGNWELRRIAIDGRAPSTVFVDPRRYSFDDPPVWMGPDRMVFLGDDSTSVHLVDANGGMPEQIAQMQGEVPGALFSSDIWAPPAGDHLYITVFAQTEGEAALGREVYELNVVTKELRNVVSSAASFRLVNNEFAVFFRDDTLVAARWDASARGLTGPVVPVVAKPGNDTSVRVSATGTLAFVVPPPAPDLGRIMSVNRKGVIEPVTDVRRRFGGHVIVSPSGDRLALTITGDPDPQVYALDLSTKYLRQVGDFPVAVAPAWTPDGLFVINQIKTLTEQRFYSVDLDLGTEPVPLFGREEPMGFAMETNFIADGSLVIVNVVDPVTAESDVYAVDTTTLKRTPLVVSAHENRQGMVSPDGRLLAYLTSSPGFMRVEVRAFDRQAVSVGPPSPASSGHSRAPIWSHDGAELFWVDNDQNAFMVADISYTADAPPGEFTISSPRVMFSREDVNYQEDWSDYPIGVSPDTQTFYFAENRRSTEPPELVNLVLHWDRELERLLAE